MVALGDDLLAGNADHEGDLAAEGGGLGNPVARADGQRTRPAGKAVAVGVGFGAIFWRALGRCSCFRLRRCGGRRRRLHRLTALGRSRDW